MIKFEKQEEIKCFSGIKLTQLNYLLNYDERFFINNRNNIEIEELHMKLGQIERT